MPRTPLRIHPLFYIIFGLLFLLNISCQPKKDFTLISDLELGKSSENNSTISTLQRSWQLLGTTLNFQNKDIQHEADIIQLVNDGKVDIGIVKNKGSLKTRCTLLFWRRVTG